MADRAFNFRFSDDLAFAISDEGVHPAPIPDAFEVTVPQLVWIAFEKATDPAVQNHLDALIQVGVIQPIPYGLHNHRLECTENGCQWHRNGCLICGGVVETCLPYDHRKPRASSYCITCEVDNNGGPYN